MLNYVTTKGAYLMHKLAVTLETVTPLFLGGADPRGQPELRPPAFRGALRYWLRAALGGAVGDNIKIIQEAEATVFGSTDEERGGTSAVTVRTGQPSLTLMSFSQIIEQDQRTKRSAKPGGTAYLLFSAREVGRGREPERKGLFGTFTLRLSTRPGISQTEDTFKKAYASLWLLTHLGGVGSRSRRGAGALQATNIQNDAPVLSNPLSLNIQSSTPEALVTELKQGLETINQLISAGKSRPSIQYPSVFDVIHPDACKIWVIKKSYDNWNEAMDEMGRVYQNFRTRRAPDYKTVKDAMISEKPLSQPVQRAAFGLPVPFFYRSLGNANATLETEDYDRRSSPLWMRIVKLASGKYAVVLLWFQSEFLPPNEQLKLRHRHITLVGQGPNDALLKTFLTESDPIKRSSLKDKGLVVLEVNYD
jgi:CRISPR-associated protein Cmr1